MKFKEYKGTIKLTINTHKPSKWVAVDLETGHVWIGNDVGSTMWKEATKEEKTLTIVTLLAHHEE